MELRKPYTSNPDFRNELLLHNETIGHDLIFQKVKVDLKNEVRIYFCLYRQTNDAAIYNCIESYSYDINSLNPEKKISEVKYLFLSGREI